MGRKTKCTPELTERIAQLIKAGNYRETACAASGVSSRQMREWLQKGAEGLEPFASFLEAMDVAEAGAEARHVLTITSASKEDWRAAAWILSRKYHKRWGDKIQVEIQQTFEGLLELLEDVVGNACGPEITTRVLAEIARRFGEQEASETQGETYQN